MADLDALDTAILRELQADARRTNRDVAAAVGVAPTTALDRTRALRERGVIRGATLDVDLAPIGRPVQGVVALPETLGVFVTTGTEDFLVHVAVPDNEALYGFVIDRLTERPEVVDVRTSVV